MAVLGTPEYMAPEQAEIEEAAGIDWRADLYALGVVAYEMLVGRPPFTGRSPTGILYKHVHEPPPPPTELNTRLPGVLEPVLLKALSKDREARYQTADAMVAALKEAAGGEARAAQRQARLAELYRLFSQAVSDQQWATAEARYRELHALAPAYRDLPEMWVQVREARARQRELEELYQQTRARIELGAWTEARDLCQRIEAMAGSRYRDVAQLRRQVEVELHRKRAGEEQDAHLPPARERLRHPSRGPVPTWAWIVGGIAAVAIVIASSRLWFGWGSEREPTPMSTNTPTVEPSPIPTDTPAITPTSTATTEPTRSTGATQVRPIDNMVMVYVPSGKFEMGGHVDSALEMCNEFYGNCDREWFEGEQPVHTVVLDGFWIDQTEVTNAQYALCVAEGACGESIYVDDVRYNGNDYPVVGVSWYDAAVYCESAGARLPTEAEWEYAARGPEERVFPWGDEFDGTRLNYCDVNCTYDWADGAVDDGHAETALVGSYLSGISWCGALDMAGNAWEWTQDWYGIYTSEQRENPSGPDSGEGKALRGGSWLHRPSGLRGAYRYEGQPDEVSPTIGFRCARDSQ
jgi:formylglycine-generating enzyme required for sulfatase activity